MENPKSVRLNRRRSALTAAIGALIAIGASPTNPASTGAVVPVAATAEEQAVWTALQTYIETLKRKLQRPAGQHADELPSLAPQIHDLAQVYAEFGISNLNTAGLLEALILTSDIESLVTPAPRWLEPSARDQLLHVTRGVRADILELRGSGRADQD